MQRQPIVRRIGAIVPYVCRRIRFAIGGLIGGTDVAEKLNSMPIASVSPFERLKSEK